jgi:hypothetical protein
MSELTWKAALACAAAAALGACAPAETQTELAFGDAVRAAAAAQTLHPEASRNMAPPAGMDGHAARSTVERYEKSFESPPAPANVFTIGIGGAGGGAK